MKYYLSVITCFLVLISCTKESEYQAPKDNIYTPHKNDYRATKISGTSTHWGEFTLTLSYDKEELNEGIRINAQGDTVGNISVTRGSGYLKYYIRDYIPSIDNDSIDRLEQKLIDKHGAGNFKLWDSIPKVAKSIQEATIYLYTDGRIKKTTTLTYKPGENHNAVGKDFDNNYILVSTISSTYEYNSNSNICVNRIMSDLHNPTDKDLYERSLFKNEILYDRDKITSLLLFAAESGGNFIETNHYNFSYNGNQLTAIKGSDFTRTFSYNGMQVTMTTNDSVTSSYELDNNGNMIKMDDGKGNVFQIEYEQGNGNLNLFTPMTDQMLNPFFIK